VIHKAHYGKIYSAYSTKDKEEVCLKIIDVEDMKFDYEQMNLKDYKTDLENEVEILSLFSNNENSVKFYGSFIKDNKRFIITEKCDLSLKEFMMKNGKSMEIEEIKKNFIPINTILKLMQMKLIIHRDLKLDNFLVKYINTEKTKYKIKLCDYGISKFIKNDNGIFSGIKGSEDTIAPEISLQKIQNYQSNVDIFSLGIIYYQLSHNMKHPFGQCYQDCYQVYKHHYENDDFHIEFDESIKNEDFKELLRNMLKLNPKNRISWENYFNHPFFKVTEQDKISSTNSNISD
jgi:serine/threonine protein kinase